jgi:hypothetical protein
VQPVKSIRRQGGYPETLKNPLVRRGKLRTEG